MTIDKRFKEYQIKFGEVEKTRIIDENGSTATSQTIYTDGEPRTPQRVRYSIRQRVKDDKQEHQAYIDFSNEVAYDLKRLDPAFMIERTKTSLDNGYYYVVKCYTVLEY